MYLPLGAVQADGLVPHQVAVLVQREQLVRNETLGAAFEAGWT